MEANSAPTSKFRPSTLSHISGKDKRYSPISNRTINRRLKKFSVGRSKLGHGNNNEAERQEDDERDVHSAGLMRSPTAGTRVDTAASAVKNGFVEETSYDQLETGRPIRLNTPAMMDVPDRVPFPPSDKALVQRLFSPAAHRDRKRGVKYVSGPDLNALLTDTTDGFGFKSRMADAQMLATASRRAGDARGEGLSYFRLALLQDNLGAYRNALRAYKKFLGVCERSGDQPSIALALNCIGVNLHLLAVQENDQDRKERLLGNSALYHERHFENGDTRSQYVAKTNGGLVLASQGDHKGAVASFQDALKYALILKAPFEQAVAFGNLANSSFAAEDYDKARQFSDQQLSILEEVGDAQEEAARAHLLLGRVAALDGQYKEAQSHSEQSMKLATAAGARGLAKVAKCFIGANLARSMYVEVVHETGKQMAK